MVTNSIFGLKEDAKRGIEFRIRLARTPKDIKRVIAIRPDKYAIRAPDYLDTLYSAEAEDVTPDSLILFAEDTSTNEVLGTMRLEGNFTHPLKEEFHPSLKPYMPAGRLMSISRLVIVSSDSRSPIKYGLFKAATKLCQALQASWVVVTALPPMDRQFVSVLAFKYLMPSGETFSEPGYPSRRFCLLGLEVSRFSEIWEAHNPQIRKFLLEDYSPEIEVFSSITSYVSKKRKSDQFSGQFFGSGTDLLPPSL